MFIFSLETSLERSYLLCSMGPCSPKGCPSPDVGFHELIMVSADVSLQPGQPSSALFFLEHLTFLAPFSGLGKSLVTSGLGRVNSPSSRSQGWKHPTLCQGPRGSLLLSSGLRCSGVLRGAQIPVLSFSRASTRHTGLCSSTLKFKSAVYFPMVGLLRPAPPRPTSSGGLNCGC